MLVDSHCHLDRVDLGPYEGDFSRFMESTLASGVGHMLCVAIDLESYPAMPGSRSASDAISVPPAQRASRSSSTRARRVRTPSASCRKSRPGMQAG